MFSITPQDIFILIILSLYGLGMICILSGIVILVSKAAGKDIKSLATQTVRLAQKGMAEDVAGLVGHASALLDSINQLVRNTAGIGVALIILGTLLIGAAAYLTLRLISG